MPNLGPVPATPESDLEAPDRRRVRAIRDRLRAAYGKPIERPHRAPVDELILTVLSQNTNDRNRDVAYTRLTARFDSWDAVRDAPVEEVEDAIRPGGLAPTKAVRIQEILRALGDDDLSEPRQRAARGRARAAVCAAGRRAQDRRVRADVLVRAAPTSRSTRTCTASARGSGCSGPARSLEEAHDELLRVVDPEDAHEIHVSLIRHGRRTCTARNPRCDDCPLLSLCPYGRAPAGA